MPTDLVSLPPFVTPRRKRFVRETPDRFQLTARDILLVRLVAEHRFLRSTHLSELIEAPHKKICERLTSLFHAGYLDRPRAQFERYRDGGGSEAMVYALGSRGARLLVEHGTETADLDWTRKNDLAGRQFIHHTLDIADFRVALQRSVGRHPGFELLVADVLLQRAPEATQGRERPWLLRCQVRHNGTTTELGVEPDHVFAIGNPDRRFRAFLVECDRGTMPVDRTSLKQTSLKRKILTYAAARSALVHQHQFGWKAFRVLVITSTAQRADNIVKTIADCLPEHERSLFLVADRQLLTATDIIAYPWRDGRGQVQGLA